MRYTSHWNLLALAGLSTALVACATVPPSPPTIASIEGNYCAFGETVFDGRIEGGRLSGCAQAGADDFVLFIRPEGEPINTSAWYAFDIKAAPDRELTLRLDYGTFKHRYVPDVQIDGGEWRPFDGEVQLERDGQVAVVRIDPCAGCTTRFAAQPLLLPEETRGWMVALANGRDEVEFFQLGTSAKGRGIDALQSGAELKEWLLIVGRQHPPETTGAVSLQAFVQRLLADDLLANEFRQRFGLLIAPMLNPDGVVAGNWRFESSGVDLNRDWGPFDRPESRLLRDVIEERKAAGGQLVAGIDFHSTFKDVLYTQPDYETPFGWLPGVWHVAINEQLALQDPPQPPIERDSAHNPDKPTFKTWIYAEYAVPGITVELGDETAPDRLRLVGHLAAEELMRVLIKGEPNP